MKPIRIKTDGPKLYIPTGTCVADPLAPIRLEIDGQKRIIRDIRRNTESEFDGYYRGYHITITEMYERDVRARKRFSLDVAAPDGGLIVNTWEYADEFDRKALLRMTLENILS